ncbi:MAG: 16S rRNA (guanine(527)-N(7))-methyltransferase RsmG [Deltaproteobacteria bacterium]|nr:16S rRNA (guanine(527)-N(7))-methyltransferase RsmG [Deltaproteobacteria bacterium]
MKEEYTPLDLLEQGAAALGLTLARPELEQLGRYFEELKRWNARINLTGLKTDQDMAVRLFLDSLALLPFLGQAASLADLGAGAGFPGLVLKIVRPALALTLVESRGKKAAFLEYLVSLLKLPQVQVAHVTLTPALAARWGPRFAAVVSRAAFRLPALLELAAPLLEPGGLLLAPKGPSLNEQELEQARGQAARLGLNPPQVQRYHVPYLTEPRLLVTIGRPG